MNGALQEYYREIVIDHSQRPRNRGEPRHFAAKSQHQDPDTGDSVTVWLLGSTAQCDTLYWEASGSSILLASCSLMSESLKEQPVDIALQRVRDFTTMLTSEAPPESWDLLGEAVALSGIRHLPARVQCATLPWRTAKEAIRMLKD